MDRNVRKSTLDLCVQRRFRSACAFAQSDQNLHWALFWIAKDTKCLRAGNKNSDQTARMQSGFESSLGDHLRRYVFSRFGSYREISPRDTG